MVCTKRFARVIFGARRALHFTHFVNLDHVRSKTRTPRSPLIHCVLYKMYVTFWPIACCWLALAPRTSVSFQRSLLKSRMSLAWKFIDAARFFPIFIVCLIFIYFFPSFVWLPRCCLNVLSLLFFDQIIQAHELSKLKGKHQNRFGITAFFSTLYFISLFLHSLATNCVCFLYLSNKMQCSTTILSTASDNDGVRCVFLSFVHYERVNSKSNEWLKPSTENIGPANEQWQLNQSDAIQRE